MPYDASPDAFVRRIRDHLLSGGEASLLYAALELRCAVESRMQAYLEPLDHVPRSKKEDYSIPKLGKTTDGTFKLGEKMAVFTFYFDDGTPDLVLRYIPVSRRLQSIAARLGNVLHFPGEQHLDDVNWWRRLRDELTEGLAWFKLAASGDLLGAPLMRRGTRHGAIYAAMRQDDPRWPTFHRLASLPTVRTEIAYEALPHPDIAAALSVAEEILVQDDPLQPSAQLAGANNLHTHSN